MRGGRLLTCVILAACSNRAVDSATSAGKELIPAEWTVAEDTLASGEITTASLQLPAAKDISGLAGDETPRLILRCIDGKVEAFIEAGQPDTATIADSSESQPVPIKLDSVPACE